MIAFACWFFIGAGLAYLAFLVFLKLQTVVYLVAFSLLIGVTLDPPIRFLQRRGMRRWLAGLLAWLVAIALLSVPVALSVNAAAAQLPGLIKSAPELIRNAEGHLGSIGNRLRTATDSSGSAALNPTTALNYLLRGGELLINAVTDVVVVAALSLYFAIELPHLSELTLQVLPATRRERVRMITEDLIVQVGRFMLSTVLIAIVFGIGTGIWCTAFSIPYPVLLGALVAVFALIPVVGSTVGGVVVTVVSLTVDVPTAIASLIFYIAYRLAEDYVIQPRMLKFSVELPGVITVPSVILGGAILGIPGALFAIPLALIIRSLVREVVYASVDRL